jgi:uncharacterized membrane protein YbhN (UPF0104 family)
MKRHLTRLAFLSALAVLSASALAVSGAGQQAAQMIAVLGGLGPSTIGMALVLSTLSALLSGMVWWRLLRRLGYLTPFRTALTAYLSAGLAGYVVNIAGPALGSAMILRRHGVTPGRATLLTLIANALGFSGILVWAPVGLLLLSRPGMAGVLPLLGQLAVPAIAVILAVLAVAMFLVIHALTTVAGSRNRLARLLLGHARTTEDGMPSALRSRQVFALVPYSALSWVVGAGALYVVLLALNHGAPIDLGTVIGAAVLAAALGSLAFFAPEGVGVKDGALVVLLARATGLPITTLVAATLAVRALDPVTKLSLLGVLALTANRAVARLSVGAATWLRRGSIRGWLRVGLAAPVKRGAVLLAARQLASIVAMAGHRGVAHADHDASHFPDARRHAHASRSSHVAPLVTGRCWGGSANSLVPRPC